MSRATKKSKSKIHIDWIAQLKKRCGQTIEEITNEFQALGASVEHTADGVLVHHDNGSNVLGVVHLDYVEIPYTFNVTKNRFVICPRLDDRLGLFVVADILPAMGIKTDILLTDSEECGRSTASHFKPSKEYNWLYQFDRRGSDLVTYEYELEAWLVAIESAEFRLGWGSFSDICSLEHMGVCGCNVGVGYYCEHTPHCYADLTDTIAQVQRFVKLYHEFQAQKFIHIPRSLPDNWWHNPNGKADKNYYTDGDRWERFDRQERDLKLWQDDTLLAIDEDGEVEPHPDDYATHNDYYYALDDYYEAQTKKRIHNRP